MVSNETLIKVTNRDKGSVSYIIPDLNNLRRVFEYNETKMIPMEELRKLSYQVGGLILLKDCLVLDNQEAIDELLGEVEPEYFYTEEEIKNLLLYGTADQFEDCLNFAPEGVINLIKDLAVKLEINDIQKRNLILDKTGFNVTKAIEINKETSEEVKEEPKKRKSNVPTKEDNKPGRKASVPQYKVIG